MKGYIPKSKMSQGDVLNTLFPEGGMKRKYSLFTVAFESEDSERDWPEQDYLAATVAEALSLAANETANRSPRVIGVKVTKIKEV